jgi:hypothetical protein
VPGRCLAGGGGVVESGGDARDEVAVLRVWEGEYPWTMAPALPVMRLRAPDGSLVPTQRLGEGQYWNHRWQDLAVPVRIGRWAGARWRSSRASRRRRPCRRWRASPTKVDATIRHGSTGRAARSRCPTAG